LLREAAHAGLFVWAAPPTESGRPCFVVSRPNTEQRPLYRLVRAGRAEEVSILACRRRNDTAKRFGQMIVVGRGGGRRYGNTKHTGIFDDPEMAAWGLGKRRHVTRDPNVTTDEEARLYAARKLAESQRAGWSLKYTVAGHTTPALGGGVAVWTPDTTVLVDDARTGDAGIFWLESVAFVAPPTRTELTLFKPAHLTFGADA
jgi:prophage tail gpP-like protein